MPKFLTMLGWQPIHTLTENCTLTGDQTSAVFRSKSSKQYILNRVTATETINI